VDKAGRKYWEQSWTDRPETLPVDPSDRRLSAYVDRRLHEMFCSVFSGAPSTRRLLEIGCGRSRWLPYFGKHHGFSVAGVDYSPTGCQQAEALLAAAQVEGRVICADFFDPPKELLESFDVVWSLGVMEHFDDTGNVAAAFARFLRPGGVMITVIPNMRWVIGGLQVLLNAPVYRIHVPLSLRELVRAHEHAGLNTEDARYFLATNFWVVNVDQPPGIRRVLGRALVGVMGRLSAMIWAFEERFVRIPSSRVYSPYLLCVARKPRTTAP